MQRIFTGLLVLCTVVLHAAALSDQDAALCGNWQAEYIRTHQQIIQGKAPPRYAIAVNTAMGVTTHRQLSVVMHVPGPPGGRPFCAHLQGSLTGFWASSGCFTTRCSLAGLSRCMSQLCAGARGM